MPTNDCLVDIVQQLCLLYLNISAVGGGGEKASEYLRVLSALWRDDNGRSNIAEFKTHWRRRFSIKLQQCNASVISRKMAVISAGQKSCSVLDEYQFVLN